METDFIVHQLGSMAQAVDILDKQSSEIKNCICILLGYIKAEQDTNPGNGYDNQIKELKLMIIDLNIKGSIRLRQNGLIELRTRAFGSIYGRTKSEIEQKLTQKLKEIQDSNKQLPRSRRVPKLSDFFTEIYLPFKQQNIEERSVQELKRYCDILIQIGFDITLNKISTLQIEKFLYTIEKSRTRQVMRGVINNILNYAKQLSVIKSNPCDNVSKIKHVTNKGRALSFSDQLEFFSKLYTAQNIRLTEKLYYTFVYLTGTRRNEAISVRYSDIDFVNNILHIPGTKTKTSDRDIPLFPLVKRILERIQPNKQDRFFTFDKADATRKIKKATADYHLHELRHTFGTIAICVQKLDPNTVALYMGHADPYMTLNTYTHPEQLDKALFYDGSLTDEQKLSVLKNKYNAILSLISDFLDTVPKFVPTN